jgi:Zn-dependent protease with chaperone function
MVTTIRAALSVAMLLGFYLYALVAVVLLGALSLLAIEYAPGVIAGKVVWVTLAVPFAILVATWKVLRAGPTPPVGLPLGPERAPGLWAQVRAIAAAMGTRAPDDVRLVPEANAAVREDAKLLGLRRGRRHLYVGVPLLQAFTVDQVRAVLAHELGHYSQRHTRLGMLTYRGMDTIDQTIVRVGPGSLAGGMLRLYRQLYLLVSLAVRRRQELEADRAAVRVAGRQAMGSVLRHLPAVSAAWAFYLDSYVAWGLDTGVAPSDVLASFPMLLSARAAELAAIRAESGPERGSRWDSHPPIAQRRAMIAAESEPPVAGDWRPASVLVDDFETAVAQLESETFDLGGRFRMPFEQYTAAAAQAMRQREADVLYRAADRVAGTRGAGLHTVLDLVERGRAGELQRALFPPAAQVTRTPSPRASASTSRPRSRWRWSRRARRGGGTRGKRRSRWWTVPGSRSWRTGSPTAWSPATWPPCATGCTAPASIRPVRWPGRPGRPRSAPRSSGGLSTWWPTAAAATC